MAVEISFGLGMTFLAFAIGNPFDFAKEIFMNNANAGMASIWCGAAFLRGLAVMLQPKRGVQLSVRLVLPKRNDEGSIPSPRTNSSS